MTSLDERFRYIDDAGQEHTVSNVQDLVDAIKNGNVGDSTLLYDTNLDKWAKASEHDVYLTANLMARGDSLSEPADDSEKASALHVKQVPRDPEGAGKETEHSEVLHGEPHEVAKVAQDNSFQETRAASQLTVVALISLAGISGILTVLDLSALDILDRAARGTVSPNEASSLDESIQLFIRMYLVAYLVCVPAFLVWFRRKYGNLSALGAKNLKYSTGWAVGGFFVPVLNLFRPYQVMSETVRASQNPTAWKDAPTPGVVRWWWGLYLASGALGWITFRTEPTDAASLSALEAWFTLNLVSDIVTVGAAIVAIRLVWALNSWQDSTRASQSATEVRQG